MNRPQEQLRHQYLSALGISSWLPRARLPGAAPSAEWVAGFRYVAGEHAEWAADDGASGEGEYDDEVAAAEAVVPAGPAARLSDRGASGVATVPDRAPAGVSVAGAAAAGNPTGRAALARLEELTDDEVKKPAPVPVVERTESRSEPARQSNLPPPRFKLAFVLAGDWLVIDSLPPQSPQGFGPLHQRLLHGVLRAAGIAQRQTDASLLSWPMLASQTLDQGAGEAQKAVQRKLDLTLQAANGIRPLNGALLLGDAAARWVLEREEELDALRGIRFTLRANLPCVCSSSLSQALQLPELKAQLWRDLQVLVNAR